MGNNIKRLLCVISNMNTGGAETFLMKLYRSMDRSKYQMDFCLQVQSGCFYEKEIKNLGGRIFRIPPKSENAKAFKKGIADIITEHKYVYVLRITSNAMGFWDLKIAKDAGAMVCIARSSNSSDGDGIKKAIAHRIGRQLYGKYVDVKIAPSDLAARYTFGDRAYDSGEVHILQNAVDVQAYAFSDKARGEIRREFNISNDTLLVGHIGRFMTQKNHKFLLEIFSEIKKKNPSSKLILVGNGQMEDQVKRWIVESGMNDAVIFAGVRSDISSILSAIDVFVFPSLYEGMPNTVIEAQANGLPCVIADTITKEADITGLVHYLPLNIGADEWARKAIVEASAIHRNTAKDFAEAGYDIESATRTFVNLVFGE